MDNNFFDPPELEVLYALTHLDGRSRQHALGITRVCYVDPDRANWWVKERIEELHVCYVSAHPMFEIWGQKAYDRLFDMWHQMTGKGIESYPYPATVSWYTPPVSENTLLQASLEDMVESLAMGRTDVSTVKEMIQEQFCQPTFNEGAFAEYFNLNYGGCPDRVLICGEKPQRDQMAHQLVEEFESGQTGTTGRGTSYFVIGKEYTVPSTRNLQGSGGLPHYVTFIPTPDALRLCLHPTQNGAITRRLVRVSLGNTENLLNDLTYVINFFNQPGCKPALLIIVSPEPLPFDGPILHC